MAGTGDPSPIDRRNEYRASHFVQPPNRVERPLIVRRARRVPRRRIVMRTLLAAVAAVALPACAETAPCCVAQTEYAVVQAPRPPPAPPPAPWPGPVAALPSRVLVLQSTHTDRLTEVVGVIDVHAEMGGQDAALALLQARAEAMGADAVLGVEFHHGHEDGPTHLSGLAVRFLPQLP
jgi:hypothetical protein